MTIKYLVLSGGGPAGLITYGAIKYLEQQNFWKLSDIKRIYGTSIGALFGVIISLGYQWEWLDDYFIKRPWDKVTNITAMNVLNIYSNKGILDEKFFIEILKPLFTAKGLKDNLTLKELYEYTNIYMRIYTTEINNTDIQEIELSHETHPDTLVTNAIWMSAAYPILIKPLCEYDNCYIDGGLVNNFPLENCITETSCDYNEILAFKNKWLYSDNAIKVFETSTFIEFFTVLLRKMQRKIDSETKQKKIKNIVQSDLSGFDDLVAWIAIFSNEEGRKNLVNQGINDAKQFLDSYNEVLIN